MDVLNKHYPFSKLSKDQFTPDDLICLNELCTYKSPKLIAHKLNKSVAEVLEMEKRFFKKFNVHTKNALIYFSQQSQLIG